MNRRHAVNLALVAIAAAMLAIPVEPSHAIVELGAYEVDIIRCHDANDSIPFGNLADASQREVRAVHWQAVNPGETEQVRLVKVTQLNPEQTSLISQWGDACS